ncbi:hypothetical protein QBC32DRAFT_21035 [Pseudoneurospora amorphoporcata]|uniref:Uncharacterized protein n=1 Tax=Pseudoneurospora amorphoporcata TaxID=241081 RepID=A0AAN6NQD4_9PEZI|nr:hypothetical protein QBC32DRAFT_21035 [Pseudoneurospora amorphoporcata]
MILTQYRKVCLLIGHCPVLSCRERLPSFGRSVEKSLDLLRHGISHDGFSIFPCAIITFIICVLFMARVCGRVLVWFLVSGLCVLCASSPLIISYHRRAYRILLSSERQVLAGVCCLIGLNFYFAFGFRQRHGSFLWLVLSHLWGPKRIIEGFLLIFAGTWMIHGFLTFVDEQIPTLLIVLFVVIYHLLLISISFQICDSLMADRVTRYVKLVSLVDYL